MSEYVEKYDNLLIEFNDTKIFNKQLKENVEELKKKLEQKDFDNKNKLKDNDKMSCLETEEEAAEIIADIYERKKKHTDTPDLESKEDDLSEESEESEESKESEKIEYKK